MPPPRYVWVKKKQVACQRLAASGGKRKAADTTFWFEPCATNMGLAGLGDIESPCTALQGDATTSYLPFGSSIVREGPYSQDLQKKWVLFKV